MDISLLEVLYNKIMLQISMFCCIAMLSHHNDIKTGEFRCNRGKNRRETMFVQGELEKRRMNDKKKFFSKYVILYICT